MSYLRLQEMDINPTWRFNSATECTLRIFASQSFYENTTGEFIAQGTVTNSLSYYKSYTCPITAGIVRLPSVTLATTTDSTVPNVTYDAWLFDSQGVRRFPVLTQFFVDQYALQVQPQSAAEVTGAGTSSAIGIYTERGIFNGKNYYNLEGEIDSTANNAIFTNGFGIWRMSNAAGTLLYSSLNDVPYPWDAPWQVTSGVFPAPVVAEYSTILSSTWEQLTLINQGSIPWPQPINEYWTTTQVEQYINSRIGDGTTPFAAELVIGKTALSVDPDIASQPCAIGCNDPTYLALTQAGVYVETYGCNQAGLDAAIAAIGVDTKPLIFSCPVIASVSTPIPDNCIVTFQGTGQILPNGGVTVTINNMAPTAPYQIFGGAGNVVFEKNAVPYFNLSWWAGTVNAGDCTHAFTQASLSRALNGGGILYIGAGTWQANDWEFGDNGIVRGSGNSTNAGGATIIHIKTGVTNSQVVSVKQDFRNRVYQNLCISVGSTTSNNCVRLTGSVPNSGINCVFDNVTFIGTGATSVPQVYIKDADGAHAWESINVQFNHCQWATPSGTKSYHVDTVNSLVTFNGRQANNPVNSIFGYLEYSGWTYDNSADNRGVAGLTAQWDSNRTIRVNLAFGSKDCTVTSGTITLNDIGQQVMLNNGIGIQTTYITGITSATTFTVEDNSTGTLTDEDCDILWYTPDPAGAMAVWQIVHGHNTLQIDNTTDEGYQYFIINGASDNLSPINVNGGIIQSLIQLNAACVLNVNGCRLRSQLFEDVNGVRATIGMSVSNSMTSMNLGGATLLKPTPWGVNNGTSVVSNNFNYNFNGGSFAEINEQTIERPTIFIQDPRHAGSITTPIVGVYASDQTGGGPHKRLIAYGRTEPTSGIPDYQNWFEHDYDTGFSIQAGNQPLPNRGYSHDATVYTDTTFAGSAIDATVTADEHNWTPGGSAQFIRVTVTGGDWEITGLGLTGTSLFAMLTGEVHQIWNVGATHTLTLPSNSTGSSAANRFLIESGNSIVLSPNEGADVWYDGSASGTGRWRATKKNISYVTSDPTNGITLGAAVVASSTLDVVGATTLEDDVAISGNTVFGPGFDFTATITPSSSGNGDILLGNSPTNFIHLDENNDLITLAATDFDVVGSFEVTGAINSTTSIRAAGSIGLTTGAGGVVTQTGSRTATVVINKSSGAITLFSAAGSATPASFTVDNSTVAATDVIIVNQKSGTDKYIMSVTSVTAGHFVITSYTTGGTTTEQPIFSFAVLKAVTS